MGLTATEGSGPTDGSFFSCSLQRNGVVLQLNTGQTAGDKHCTLGDKHCRVQQQQCSTIKPQHLKDINTETPMKVPHLF